MWAEEQYYGTQEMVDRTVSEIFKRATIFNHRTEGIDITPENEQLEEKNPSAERSQSYDRYRRHSNLRRQKTISKKAPKRRSYSSDFSNYNDSDRDDLQNVAHDSQMLIRKFLKSLSRQERSLLKNIVKLDSEVKQMQYRIHDLDEKIKRMERKYVSMFRANNPDLRHFRSEQIKNYTDLLVKESQNLRSPNSTILVAGGVLFIFFGTFSLSILIARVFYKDY